MSYEVKYTSRFKRDYKRMQRRGRDIQKLLDVIDMLREQVHTATCSKSRKNYWERHCRQNVVGGSPHDSAATSRIAASSSSFGRVFVIAPIAPLAKARDLFLQQRAAAPLDEPVQHASSDEYTAQYDKQRANYDGKT